LGDLVPLIEQMAAGSSETGGTLASSLAWAYSETDRLDDALRLLQQFAENRL
jgi:hypothetical protein